MRTKWVAAVVAAVVLVAAGCGSSSKSGTSSTTSGTASSESSVTSGSGSGSGSGQTYTLGILVDLTGPGSTNSLKFPQGVKAGVALAESEGYKIKTVVADTATSPTQTLAAAQKLVEQDHVFAVLALSALTFAAEPFLAQKGIPVIGANIDGPEWTTQRNMFSVSGTADYTKVFTQQGLSFKQLGATNLAAVGYSISPSSSDTAKSNAISAQLAGVKVGYLNTNLPLGTTDVQPIALAMKAAGVDSLEAPITTNTAFAIVAAMKSLGAPLKVTLNSTGYGGDLIQGGQGALQVAQGQYFLSGFEPIEMNTAATQQFVSYLKGAGVTTAPAEAQYYGYMVVDAFVQGLKVTGPNPSQSAFINAMLGITNFNGVGLYGSHSVSFALATRGQVSGADNCIWNTQYLGTTFHLVPNQDPICGETVPGKRV
jgi:ABC-type branched-subunit amino acid transport system substrate-binding protein